MRLLLDTHIFLWAILEPESLTPPMQRAIVSPSNELLLSTASIWEIGTKYSLNKLPLALPPEVLIPQQMQIQNILPLSLTLDHALAAHKLPWHHRDPFDRMIIAQSQIENLKIITSDKRFADYKIDIIS